ncbi:MAG: response regulator [Oscillospiraceae bacterium]|jgi:DNA-binding response OmpR family regulator|nr:response regulator [Oscillospiraceae bacterium]
MNERDIVLVVDDDENLLRTADELLGGVYEVSLMKSGEQALRFLAKGALPDIMLLDIQMPDMDGYETLTRMREIPGAEYIPVIFLTGLTEPEAELKGLNFGAVDFITKPFVREILLARLQVHLVGGKERRELRALQNRSIEIDEDKFVFHAKTLTDTEQKILRRILMGYGNREIGTELNYSYEYVKKVTKVIFSKFDVGKRAALREMFLKRIK